MSVFEDVKTMISEKLEIEPASIVAEATFQDLKIDSLDMYEMMYEVEQRFGIEIPEAETQSLDSVGALVAFIERSKN
jgi:acyl carrier protein